jgi:urease accessory protein
MNQNPARETPEVFSVNQLSTRKDDRRIHSAACVGLAALLLGASNAWGHAEVGVAGGLISGFLHPIFGIDHLVAMVAVGLWGAQLGSPAVWLLPITFPAVMALGAMLGVLGIPLPGVELGVSASALALGALVAFAVRLPLWLAGTLVAAFAIFHGHAHGTELPTAANPLAYGVGFVVSTGLLHLCGILIGVLVRWPVGAQAVRACGAVVACLGMFFLAGNLGLTP